MSESSDSNGGIGFRGMLCIAFIVLKLTGYVAWSWWWVLSPIWIPIAFWVTFFVIAFLFLGTLGIIQSFLGSKTKEDDKRRENIIVREATTSI